MHAEEQDAVWKAMHVTKSLANSISPKGRCRSAAQEPFESTAWQTVSVRDLQVYQLVGGRTRSVAQYRRRLGLLWRNHTPLSDQTQANLPRQEQTRLVAGVYVCLPLINTV